MCSSGTWAVLNRCGLSRPSALLLLFAKRWHRTTKWFPLGRTHSYPVDDFPDRWRSIPSARAATSRTRGDVDEGASAPPSGVGVVAAAAFCCGGNGAGGGYDRYG